MKDIWTTVAVCAAITFSVTMSSRAEADMSTPKKAAVSFAKAVMAGDADGYKAVSTGTDAEFALVKSLSDMAMAMKRLEDASTKKFGADGKLPKEMAMDLVGDMETSDEKIDGDNATLVLKSKPDDKFPPTLKKEGDKWKVDLTNLSKDPQSAGMSTMIPAMVKVMNNVAKGAGDDKYKTAAELYTDLGTQMNAALAPPAPAAAEPAK